MSAHCIAPQSGRVSWALIAAVVLLASLVNCDKKSSGTLPGASIPVKDTMVLVPAGWFTMGSDSGEADERPAHRVWLDSFLIDRYPVTNANYAQFIAATGHPPPLYFREPACNGPYQPVVGVSWNDAQAYCQWRSVQEHATVRLPTEAQWEKAARGDDARIYPWGNNAPTKKQAPVDIVEKMPSVGMCDLGRSPYGVYDLVGNVWNWCADWYDPLYYQHSPDHNPIGSPDRGKKGKAVRGGNWVFLGCCSGTPAYALRVARRNAFHEKMQKKSIGFRCVKDIVSTTPSDSGATR